MRSQSEHKEVAATDTQTTASLFRQYGDDVFRLAYSYLGNRQDAEDVCQSVFLKLAEKQMPLQPGKEKSWLLTCAANASKNLLRSFWRKSVTALEGDIPFSQEQLKEGFLGENFPPVTGWTHEFLYDEEGSFLLDEDGFPIQEHRQFTSTDYTFLSESYEMPNGCTATLITARFNEPDGTQGHRQYMGYFLQNGILYTLRPYATYDPSQDFPMVDIDARTVLLEALDSFG